MNQCAYGVWKSQGDLPPISIPQTNWLQTPSIVQIKKGKWTVFSIKVALIYCYAVMIVLLWFFFAICRSLPSSWSSDSRCEFKGTAKKSEKIESWCYKSWYKTRWATGSSRRHSLYWGNWSHSLLNKSQTWSPFGSLNFFPLLCSIIC